MAARRSRRSVALLLLTMGVAVSSESGRAQEPQPVRQPSEPALAFAAEAAARVDAAGILVHRDVVYRQMPGVDATRLSLDLYTPAEPPGETGLPIILYVRWSRFFGQVVKVYSGAERGRCHGQEEAPVHG